MFSSSKTRLRLVIIILVSVGALILLFPGGGANATSTASPVLAECSLTEGSHVVRFAGAQRDNISSLSGIKADLWHYNPSPIYKVSLFWVMMDNPGAGTGYVQVGWRKDDGWSTEKVWAEGPDVNEPRWTKFWWSSSPHWRSTAGSHPTSSANYKIVYISEPLTDKFTIYKDGDSFSHAQDDLWTPDRIVIAGESQNQGDHSPGDTSNHINSNNNKYKTTGSWSDVNWNWNTGKILDDDSRMDLDTNNQSGDGFRIWDPRCSN